MREIDYSSWADYLVDLIDLYPLKSHRLLELGAGNCSISKYLVERYPDYIVSDLSYAMLLAANPKLRRVTADMTKLPFKKEFDVIFSIFDSVNYLINDEAFISFLSEAGKILNDDGVLTFDVSLEKNSKKYIKQLNRNGSVNGIKYFQKSDYDKKTRIHTNTFNINIDGVVFSETHHQKIYLFEEYFLFAEEAGLRVIDCFDCFTFDDANSRTERAQFVLGKN